MDYNSELEEDFFSEDEIPIREDHLYDRFDSMRYDIHNRRPSFCTRLKSSWQLRLVILATIYLYVIGSALHQLGYISFTTINYEDKYEGWRSRDEDYNRMMRGQ